MIRAAVVVIVSAALASAACGTQPSSPARPGGRSAARAAGPRADAPGAAREAALDTGAIEGRIVASGTNAPLRRVEISVTADGSHVQRTVSDADGRYTIKELAAGRYRLSYAKAGYVTIDLGQRRPFAAGREITVGDGETVRGVDVHLARGAVVSGRVVDDLGEPVAHVLVEAIRWGYAQGRRVLQTVPSGAATTDDLGQYRLYGLPAGDVFLRASTGFRGAAPAEDAHGFLVFYVPVYYPGTPDLAQAERMTLTEGQEIRGRDFPFKPAPGVRIAGVVVGSSGAPRSSGEVTLLQFADGMYERPAAGIDSARISTSGTFVLTGVAPGQYVLRVETSDVVERPDGRGGTFRQTSGYQFALVPVVVKGEDQTGLRVLTSRGATVRGRIVFDNAASPRFGPNSVTVSAPPVGFPPARSPVSGMRGSVRTDWSFDLNGLVGPRVFRVTEPVGWMLKSVRRDGRDITDTPIEFKGTEVLTGLEIVLSNTTAEIAGRVITADGRAAMDYAVVIFPDDPEKWQTAALPAQPERASRVVKVGRPDQRGQFRVTGLPAGRYLAVAVMSIEDGAWNAIDVLKRLRPLGAVVNLGDGEKMTIELKLSSVSG